MVFSDIDVKHWVQDLPSVEGVRPSWCPGCGAAGRVVGASLGLVGHGVRGRLQLGPSRPGVRPSVDEVIARRYRCRGCRAVVTVLPRGLAPRLRYRLGAVVSALGAWWRGAASAEVRRRFSPFVVVGEEARRGWRSLRRWTRWLALTLGAELVGDHVRRAEVVLQRLAARAPGGTGELVADALAGVGLVDGLRLRSSAWRASTM